jgi:hypothetical protein
MSSRHNFEHSARSRNSEALGLKVMTAVLHNLNSPVCSEYYFVSIGRASSVSTCPVHLEEYRFHHAYLEHRALQSLGYSLQCCSCLPPAARATEPSA